MEKTIKEISRNAVIPLLNVSKNGAKRTKEFYINCSELEDFNHIDIRNSEKYKLLFDELRELDGPCLYYFEIISNNLTSEIIEKIEEYSFTENSKSIPAIKKRFQRVKYFTLEKSNAIFGEDLFNI